MVRRRAIDLRNKLHRKYVQRRTREKREEIAKARKEAEKTCRRKNRIFVNEQVHLIEKQFKNSNNM